jgi:hypothetical protein
MARKNLNQQGFITMIVMMLVILIAAITLVYLRVKSAHQ